MLSKVQKQLYRNVGPTRAASLKAMAHHQNEDRLSLLYWY